MAAAFSERWVSRDDFGRASQVLAQGVPISMPKSYCALADHGGVPHSTLHHCTHGRRSLKQKAESQQYLTL